MRPLAPQPPKGGESNSKLQFYMKNIMSNPLVDGVSHGSLNMKYTQIPILIFILFSLSSCMGGWQPPPQMPVPVKTLQIKEQTIADSSDYLSVLKSRKSVTFSSEFIGTVSKIYVRSGDKVKRGQLLIQLRADSEYANLNSSRADSASKKQSLEVAKQNLNSYKAQLQEAKDKLDIAQKQYTRYQELFGKQLISKTQLEQYEDALIQAKSQYQSVKAQETMRQHEIEMAKSDLNRSYSSVNQQKAIIDKLRVTAPFSGTVGDVPIKEGDLVNPQIQLISLANIDELEVYVNIPADKISKLEIGSKIELLNTEKEVAGESTVNFISPTVDPDSQTVLVKANYINDQRLFRDAQETQVRINWGESEGVLIPTGAVNRFGRNTFVFVVVKGKNQKGKPANIAKQIEVKLADIQNNNYKLISGLKPGQTIVTEGIEKLYEGTEVILGNENMKSKKALNKKK